MCLGFRGRRRRGQKRVSELDPFQISQCEGAGAQSSTRKDRRIKITDENKTRIHNANPQSQRPQKFHHPRHGIHTTHEAPSPKSVSFRVQIVTKFVLYLDPGKEQSTGMFSLLRTVCACVRARANNVLTNAPSRIDRALDAMRRSLTFEMIKILARDEKARSSAIPPFLH